MTRYKYLGDRSSSASIRGACCTSVINRNGKCIRGKNGNMLVEMDGRKMVVLARALRKISL